MQVTELIVAPLRFGQVSVFVRDFEFLFARDVARAVGDMRRIAIAAEVGIVRRAQLARREIRVGADGLRRPREEEQSERSEDPCRTPTESLDHHCAPLGGNGSGNPAAEKIVLGTAFRAARNQIGVIGSALGASKSSESDAAADAAPLRCPNPDLDDLDSMSEWPLVLALVQRLPLPRKTQRRQGMLKSYIE